MESQPIKLLFLKNELNFLSNFKDNISLFQYILKDAHNASLNIVDQQQLHKSQTKQKTLNKYSDKLKDSILAIKSSTNCLTKHLNQQILCLTSNCKYKSNGQASPYYTLSTSNSVQEQLIINSYQEFLLKLNDQLISCEKNTTQVAEKVRKRGRPITMEQTTKTKKYGNNSHNKQVQKNLILRQRIVEKTIKNIQLSSKLGRIRKKQEEASLLQETNKNPQEKLLWHCVNEDISYSEYKYLSNKDKNLFRKYSQSDLTRAMGKTNNFLQNEPKNSKQTENMNKFMSNQKNLQSKNKMSTEAQSKTIVEKSADKLGESFANVSYLRNQIYWEAIQQTKQKLQQHNKRLQCLNHKLKISFQEQQKKQILTHLRKIINNGLDITKQKIKLNQRLNQPSNLQLDPQFNLDKALLLLQLQNEQIQNNFNEKITSLKQKNIMSKEWPLKKSDNIFKKRLSLSSKSKFNLITQANIEWK